MKNKRKPMKQLNCRVDDDIVSGLKAYSKVMKVTSSVAHRTLLGNALHAWGIMWNRHGVKK